MAKHNKKRNVGLIHEQLVRYASERVVEGNTEDTSVALSVLSKHFEPGTELYKEFRLFNALVHTRVESKDIARRIISESKFACKNHDASKLTTEKSILIRSINHDLNESAFYARRIPEYRVFATVQALLNEWRGANRLSPDEIIKYELVLEEWLTRPRDEGVLDKKPDANPLVLKIMIDKFNEKYAPELNAEQTQLLESTLHGEDKASSNYIEVIKQRASSTLRQFYTKWNNRVLNSKRELIEHKIATLTTATDDITIQKALTLSQLIEEMEDGNE